MASKLNMKYDGKEMTVYFHTSPVMRGEEPGDCHFCQKSNSWPVRLFIEEILCEDEPEPIPLESAVGRQISEQVKKAGKDGTYACGDACITRLGVEQAQGLRTLGESD